MSASDQLPPPPRVTLEVVRDRSAEASLDGGFLRLRRLELRHRYPDGQWSSAYDYDVVEREAMDAVLIVLTAASAAGPLVCMRSAIRPPLAFRPGYAVPLPSEGEVSIWELPAGLVEPDERGARGLCSCAARETLEEVGLDVPPGEFRPLGPPAYLSPGMIAEQLHFMMAEVDPSRRGEPLEDGSPVESRAEVRFISLERALSAVDERRIGDVKTELALRRLADWWELR